MEISIGFLGFTIKWARIPHKGPGNKFWNILPSRNSEKKIRRNIKETLRTSMHLKPAVYVSRLNTKLKGWVNYYRIDGVRQIYTFVSRIEGGLGHTIYRMFKRKSRNGRNKIYRQYTYKKFILEHGLIDLYQCIYRKQACER